MLIITKIETIEVPIDECLIDTSEKELTAVPVTQFNLNALEVPAIEHVKGQRFLVGAEFKTFGMLQEVRDQIGAPFKLCKQHERENFDLKVKVNLLESTIEENELELNAFNNMGFWETLKLAFSKLF